MKRRFLVFSIVLLLSISLFSFSSLAVTSDELLGEWVLKEGNFIHFSDSFYVDGVFEFPEISDYLENEYGLTEVTRIGISIEEEEENYYSGYFWVSTPEIYDEGGYYELCYFKVDVDDWEDPNNGIIDLNSCFWVSPEITYFNIVSLSLTDSNSLNFNVFISTNFERPVLPPEPTNVYRSCYNLINTWVFGGEIVPGSYHDLVCIQLSTIAVLLFFSIPFIVVFWLLRRVC